MAINPTAFHKINIVDSCSIWNVLSSLLLWSRARQAACYFSCTQFIVYECMFKRRKIKTSSDDELKRRMANELKSAGITAVHLELEDLQEVEVLARRRNLGKGELSAIAFARRTGQAILTDDQKARRLAEAVLNPQYVQTVPQLAAWLLYVGYIADSEFDDLIREHESLGRPLRPHFETARKLSLEARLASGS
jgi:predicted nucleic acid-binding protein